MLVRKVSVDPYENIHTLSDFFYELTKNEGVKRHEIVSGARVETSTVTKWKSGKRLPCRERTWRLLSVFCRGLRDTRLPWH